jgi:hypothetical protein
VQDFASGDATIDHPLTVHGGGLDGSVDEIVTY